ncbi:hypothetical protein AX17_003707 [Amanita inopinata Kibby_2008]|nr:hypothetical protein AX17_003707 [Amanita inopinata Kibby_2008]
MSDNIATHPEICHKIAFWVGPRVADLAALCRTSKVFQREAEIRLYENLMFLDPAKAFIACRTVIMQSRYGPLVRHFRFNQESRRQQQNLPRNYWAMVQDALSQMSNLETLQLFDSTFANSWVLEPERISFRLTEAKLRFSWDENVVNFLHSQPKLRVLQIIEPMDEVQSQIQPNALPFLQIFDGNFMIAMQFLACPLTHLQAVVDVDGPQALELLPRLALAHETLRGLSLLALPEDISTRALGLVANSCPLLRHIGLIYYPIVNRYRFHQVLMQMHYVQTIELDIHRWQPLPSPSAQRAIAAEIRMYRPTIKQVVLWVGQTRLRWILQGDEWYQRVDSHQYPDSTTLWSVA